MEVWLNSHISGKKATNAILCELPSCYRRKFLLSRQTEVVNWFEHLLNLNPLYRFSVIGFLLILLSLFSWVHRREWENSSFPFHSVKKSSHCCPAESSKGKRTTLAAFTAILVLHCITITAKNFYTPRHLLALKAAVKLNAEIWAWMAGLSPQLRFAVTAVK